jgi:polyferredoxin
VYFLGRKGFCRYLCPWGAFLKLPNSLAMFKVRNTGDCSQCGNCTSECPIGIDVSYEINNYGKVTNTNCTSCLVCTEGCPSSAISYKWASPMNENFQLKHYGINRDMFKLKKIADKFQSLHSRDFLFLPLVLIFGFAIDGLYGMGHFLSFGIAVIASVQVITLKENIQNSKARNLLIGMIFLIIAWHGVVKVSIWQGLEQYEKNKYSSAISHLERAIKMYPKPIGRFHLILGQMYMENGEVEKARAHAIRAQNINPNHDAPVELLKKINVLE